MTETTKWAPLGSLQNVLEILNEALKLTVTTSSTNPPGVTGPGVTGPGGQAITSWVETERIEIARLRLAEVIQRERDLALRWGRAAKDSDMISDGFHGGVGTAYRDAIRSLREIIDGPQPIAWPRWECSNCTRNMNQCKNFDCCDKCNHTRDIDE